MRLWEDTLLGSLPSTDNVASGFGVGWIGGALGGTATSLRELSDLVRFSLWSSFLFNGLLSRAVDDRE